MKKIKILVAHNDTKVKDEVINSIKRLQATEIIGISENGEDTYEKIIDLKPEIVFAKYDFGELDGLDIIQKTEGVLKEKTPIFNLIVGEEKIPEEKLEETLRNVGEKLNAFVRTPYGERVTYILEEQIENRS